MASKKVTAKKGGLRKLHRGAALCLVSPLLHSQPVPSFNQTFLQKQLEKLIAESVVREGDRDDQLILLDEIIPLDPMVPSNEI